MKNLVGWVYIALILLIGAAIGSDLTFRYCDADLKASSAAWLETGHRWRHVGMMEGKAASLNRLAHDLDEGTEALNKCRALRQGGAI